MDGYGDYDMKKFALVALSAAVVAFAPSVVSAKTSGETVVTDALSPAASSVNVTAGKMLYGANNARVASIYRVTPEGAPQVILNGRLVTVPATTLSEVDGKVTTTLTRVELSRLR